MRMKIIPFPESESPVQVVPAVRLRPLMPPVLVGERGAQRMRNGEWENGPHGGISDTLGRMGLEPTQRWLPDPPPRRSGQMPQTQAQAERVTPQRNAWGAFVSGMGAAATVLIGLHELCRPEPDAGLIGGMIALTGLCTGCAVYLIRSDA